MTRLLQRNERAIAAAPAPDEHARLLAQRVLLLARHWRSDELPDALAGAEAAVSASGDPHAAAELALGRGVATYYGAQVARSVEHVQRARDEAIRLGDAGLEAECEAWLGCIGCTLHSDPAPVLDHLQRAIQLGLRARPLAAARAFYIGATLYQEADLLGTSMQLYRRASALARSGHDEQLLAAIHRYMTLGQVQQLRRAHAAGQADDEQRKQTLAALGSARELAGALTPDDDGLQFRLREGEMLCLTGRHEEALNALHGHLDEAVRRGASFEATIARAHQAVSFAHCGRLAEAQDAGTLAEVDLAGAFDAYTRAVVLDALAQLATLLGDAELARRRGEEALACWREDRAYCRRLREALLAHGPLSED
jgi:hypothetical protein